MSRFLWRYVNSQAIADIDNPNVIMYGPPGTGKTYSVVNSLDFVTQGDSSRYELLQFHPSFTYEDFIEGIKPVMSEDDITQELTYKIEDGVFKALCEEAKNDPGNRYAIFIDEINRGNVSAIFGELITLIEQDKRKGEKNGGTGRTEPSARLPLRRLPAPPLRRDGRRARPR